PLQSVTLEGIQHDISDELKGIIKEELNVKEVLVDRSKSVTIESARMNLKVTDNLRKEGIIREIIRLIQNARKEAGFAVEDRISLLIESESPEITQYIEEFKQLIISETLVGEFGEVPKDSFSIFAKIESIETKIFVSRYII
ncbi:MAG TPA: DUF5915 domain-containing protein, partial [Candidatus Saccharimonadales bacterium]